MSDTRKDDEFEPIQSVEFRAAKDNKKRSVGASIKEKGELLIDGLDWITERDYEYSITVEERFKDSVLLLLLQEKFADFPEARAWFEERKIPFVYFVWS